MPRQPGEVAMPQSVRSDCDQRVPRYFAQLVLREVAVPSDKSSSDKERHGELKLFQQRQRYRQIVAIAIIEGDGNQRTARRCTERFFEPRNLSPAL